MCGRVTQKLSSAEYAAIFEARDLATTPGGAYNVAPTQGIVAVRIADGERVADRLRWGLVPSWSDGPDPRGRLINARAETVASSPAFRASFRSKRCLVPVDGFYEWRKTDGRSVPFYIAGADGRPLALAGLWSSWTDPASGLVLRSCAVITTTPNETMAPIHDRMPAIVPPDAWARWLAPDADPGELAALLGPAAATLAVREVRPLVNNPRNQGPDLIVPVEAPVSAAG